MKKFTHSLEVGGAKNGAIRSLVFAALLGGCSATAVGIEGTGMVPDATGVDVSRDSSDAAMQEVGVDAVSDTVDMTPRVELFTAVDYKGC